MKTTITTIVLLLSTLVSWSQIELPAKLYDRPEQIICHTGYTLSYNRERGTPNWSAWIFTRAKVKQSHLSRTDVFLADPFVPIAYRIQPSDYTNSGYDRGHMCPAADMAYSSQAMHDCFYMSNMCPQVPALNRVSWKALESACRKWAMTEDTLYIVAGPYYAPNEPIKYLKNPLFQERVRVRLPTGFYKVVLSLRRGHAKAIGFYYANSSNKQSLQSTARSVDEIERLTGLDFYSTLDDHLEEKIESHCNIKDWK